MAASRHPDHRPEITPVFRSSCGLRLRRSRQTASALRRAGNLRRSASPSAPGAGRNAPPKSNEQGKSVTTGRISLKSIEGINHITNT
ncbi:hypothetical protein NXV74_14470 [Bacteroides thetaiotaomicron]|nr:hypothetical protein [Bacteroides thetaiotaomicron]